MFRGSIHLDPIYFPYCIRADDAKCRLCFSCVSFQRELEKTRSRTTSLTNILSHRMLLKWINKSITTNKYDICRSNISTVTCLCCYARWVQTQTQTYTWNFTKTRITGIQQIIAERKTTRLNIFETRIWIDFEALLASVPLYIPTSVEKTISSPKWCKWSELWDQPHICIAH